MLASPLPIWAQTAPSSAAPTAPNVSAGGPATAVSSGRPGASTAGQVLTLPGIVARVLGNNSGLELARQRLQRAQESINQVNAQTRPQFRLNANDTYSSYPAFPAALPVPTLTVPALPDNGQIPTVTDQANSFSTAFVGSTGLALGGGAGTVSPGAVGGTSGTAGTTSAGTGVATPGTSGPASPGTGATPGTTGGTGAGTNGSGSNGNAPGSGSGVNGTAPTAGTPNTGTGQNGAPGTGTPNMGTAPASPNGAAPAAPSGPAAPGSTAPVTPGDAGGTAMAPASYPAIVADYVADARTLLSSFPAEAKAPVVHISAARAKESSDDEPSLDTPRRPADDTTGGTITAAVSPVRGRRDTYAAGGNVTQYIDLFGLAGAARTAEQDVRDFYALDITRLQNETALAAKNLFFNVLYAQSLVATQQEQVAYAQENVRITESRLRNGIVSRFDVLTAQAALATAQQQQTAAQNQYELAQSELSYLLGTDPDQPQTLQPPVLPPLGQSVDLRQSTQIAERQRPELRQAGRNIDNARHQARLAQAGLLPTLGLVGSGEYTSNGSTITPRSYGTVSAQVALPLDDGGLTRSRVRSAQVQVQTQTITQGQLQLSVALEVRQATVNIRNAQAEAAAARVGADRSQEAVRLARERYGAGLGTFLDVLNALAQLATARTNLANAEYFYQSSLAQLVRAMGGR